MKSGNPFGNTFTYTKYTTYSEESVKKKNRLTYLVSIVLSELSIFYVVYFMSRYFRIRKRELKEKLVKSVVDSFLFFLPTELRYEQNRMNE